MCRFTTNIPEAASFLQTGLLVAFPTETVYGLGADAQNCQAVARIFEVKGRPTFDPLIVHIAAAEQMFQVVTDFPKIAMELAARFWPGPLTLVLPKRPEIPDLVTAGLPGVGIRIPDHPVALALLKQANCPVAAPSANKFGRISPTTAEHVAEGLGEEIPLILDGGPCRVGVESTVISLMSERPTLLRPGGCPAEEIEKVTGPLERATPNPALEDSAQPAPGMLSRHYAPRTPLWLVPVGKVAEPFPGARCGLLSAGDQRSRTGFSQIELLSSDGDLRTSAANFFAALRRLDAAGLDAIIAHQFPNFGLGLALNDRLRRAAAGSGEPVKFQPSQDSIFVP
ncbi:MAG: threonylcarbamoyl-AMP synthase [Planctomyces sp.]|nr:threonylcarbamoyl-AMP synthase [Planctomyces sp.]